MLRAGFSLVELLIVIVLLAVVLTSVMTIFVHQQRFYSDAAAIMETRSSTRDAAYVLQSDLRALSPKNGDIYAMGSKFVEFRAQPGSSVVCTIDGTRTVLTVPPLHVATGAALTSWLAPPAWGDTLLIFDTDTIPGSGGNHWRTYTLTAAPAANGSCPNATGLTTTSGEASLGWTMNVTPALTAGTLVGAPIRLMRRARFELYQEASGNWYLGYYDCLPSRTPACGALQPVAGPYVPPNNGGTGGIVFTFLDATGTVTASKTLVRRVDLAARAQTAVDIKTAGYKSGAMTDSTFSSIAPRN
ncbi:MAG: prepilin-type N-terminal cleavage/methylation domain-containing protein [Gemmatimonadaceae bacterium]|nr:prepilin-type N-terminal cleavage/methylation domain-containing protein [Gemmatimonadaceae bacterium]